MQNGCMHTVTHTLARLYALLVLTIKLLKVFLSELQKANVSIHVFDSIGSSDQLILIRQLSRQVAILANQNHCANHPINSLAHYVVAVKKFNQPLCKMLRPRLPLVLGFFMTSYLLTVGLDIWIWSQLQHSSCLVLLSVSTRLDMNFSPPSSFRPPPSNLYDSRLSAFRLYLLLFYSFLAPSLFLLLLK